MTEVSRSYKSWKNVYPPAQVIDKLLSALPDSWVEGELGLQVLSRISVHRDLWCYSFWGSNSAVKQIPSTGSWLPQFPMMTACWFTLPFSLCYVCLNNFLTQIMNALNTQYGSGDTWLLCYSSYPSMCIFDFFLYILLGIPMSYGYLLLVVDSFSPSKYRRFLGNTLSNSIFS